MKILNDTLKNSKGKYSRKSITAFASFVLASYIGVFIVVSNLLFDVEINPYAVQVFFGFLSLTGGVLGITVWDKFKNNAPKEGEDELP